MTGPEHYAEAESLLSGSLEAVEVIAKAVDGGDVGPSDVSHSLAFVAATISRAQVHATLALAAATAEPIATNIGGPDDDTFPRAWSEAIS